MPYDTTTYNIMIASPGDVRNEREFVRNTIYKWNASHSESAGIMLNPVGWDTNSYPSMEGRAQGLLNKQILKNSDLLVAIFWTRLGTPTGEALSGTVEEIERHIDEGKPAMIYFSNAPIPPPDLDHNQYKGLIKFKEECKLKGLIEEFSSIEEFMEKFPRHLDMNISSHSYFKRHGKHKYKTTLNTTETKQSSLVTLAPNPRLSKILAEFPSDLFHDQIAIDGAIEVISLPQDQNRYGGFSRKSISMEITNEEWSSVANSGSISKKAIDQFAKGLLSWLPPRRAKPNRIRFLLEPPIQPVLDHKELNLKIGNSDYFTMRAVTEISRNENNPTLGIQLKDVFETRWGKAGESFPGTCVPYHISAQGVLFVTDPESGNTFLILTLPNAQRSPLVKGWNATFAEQMWAPTQAKAVRPWWSNYTRKFDIEEPKDRQGDIHIEDTVLRGLEEELGITENDLQQEKPKLVSACIEQDLYFITFIYVIDINMSLRNLYQRKQSSSDREIGSIVAYPIQGRDSHGEVLNPCVQFSKILKSDTFDGAPYALPTRATSLPGPWHISSRMRIYTAARHLVGDEILNYVQVTR